MSLIGKIQALFTDREQTQPIFPMTKIKAVSDDDGKGLNAVLDDMTAHTKKVGAPHNLLDNSDFRNPVNQRGQTSYSGAVYMIDRWKGANANLTVNGSSIAVSRGDQAYGLFAQFTPDLVVGNTYTYAVKKTSGEVAVLVFVPEIGMSNCDKAFSDSNHSICARYSTAASMFYVGFGTTNDTSLDVVWAALYEGEYTAETLPEYQPKGHAAELLECQRYYYKFHGITICGTIWGGANPTGATFSLFTPVPMRVFPTTINIDIGTLRANGNSFTPTDVIISAQNGNKLHVTANGTYTNSGNHAAALFGFSAELSADL